MANATENPGLLAALVADGRPLLKLTALALIASGLFAFFLAATGNFLPHDIAYLGMTVDELHSIADSRLVHFMMHDRVSFGGAILGVGVLYLWLTEFPLASGQPWAWWTLLVSGVVGFLSFLAYLGYGYLDTWHGIATLVLLPIFMAGLQVAWARMQTLPPIAVLLQGTWPRPARSALDAGRLLLLTTSACLVLGGLIILCVGVTTVFVPQDLEYMHVSPAELSSANPRLVPLIAHDRAGFGGGVACCGLTMFFCVLHGAPSRALWEAILITGLAGFGSAIGVHFPIGYTSLTHLAPAYLGAVMFISGMALAMPGMTRPAGSPELLRRAC